MAIGAGDGDMGSCQRESCQVVIKTRRTPCRSCMALGAFCREPCGNVIGVIRGGILALVAGNTRHLCASKSRRMATIAAYTDVGAR